MNKEELTYYKELVAVTVDENDVVTDIHWRYCATDGTLIAKSYHNSKVENTGEFIEYKNLDSDTILSWISFDEVVLKELAYKEYLNILPVEEAASIANEKSKVRSWI